LFYDQKIVVLFALLSQKILTIDEVISSNGTVLVGQFLLVQ
jgi:hypothetical protein